MKRFIQYFILLLALTQGLNAQSTYTVGASSVDFLTLQEAFDYINLGAVSGDIILQIIDNTTELGTAVLNSSGGGVNYTSILIYPTLAGLSISGNINGPLIDLNAADNVTFDGRVDQAGAADLTIVNTSTGTSASTFRFIESTNLSTIQYCIIKGSGTSATSGIILFSTSSSGNGNDGITIDNNYITSDAAGRPINAIFSLGSSGRENSGNTISNNVIYDFLKYGDASNGIFLSSFSNSYSITGNSFYESASFIPAAAVNYNVIQINNTGTGFTVSGNYIGGQAILCGGLAWSKTNASNNAFVAINLAVGAGAASNVQNNTIQNFDWSNSSSASWTGIQITSGDVNLGTITGNTIGAAIGTGSIVITGGATGTNIYGINISSGGAVDCRNNNIGSITAANATSTFATNFIGINKTGTAVTTTISSNIIGSTSTANSINASSLCGPASVNAQVVYGIYSSGTGTITINSNLIANLTNSTTNSGTTRPGLINGIASIAGTNTISNNIVRDLTIANGNSSATQIASVSGIALTGTINTKTVTGNTIFNLSNSFASFSGHVTGLYFSGTASGSNIVSGNFIHSLSVSSNNANISGIRMLTGLTTYYNNIISLGEGLNTATTINGIYEAGAAGNNNSIYFNTIYIDGDPTTGTKASYGLQSLGTANIRNIRNNVFYNARSNNGATGSHFAAYFAVPTTGSITCDFNDYYVSGTGGILGDYGINKAALPIVTGQDVTSLAVDPSFPPPPGGTTALDYLPSEATLVAVTGTGITTDYAGTTRSVTFPSMGAYEYTVAPGAWTWMGTAGTDWNTPANWNYISVPPASSNVIITDVANDPIVNELPATPAECENLTINTGAILTIAAGRALRVNGTITNSAGITGLVIKSDATGDGNLVNNTASVPATVELYLTGGLVSPGVGRFHYIVPPVATMTIGTVPTVAEVKTALGITNFNGDLLRYREPFAIASKNSGWQYFHNFPGLPPGFTSLVSDYGYNIYLAGGDDLLKFTGQLNATQHTFNLSYTPGNAGAGWNLLGNPYPCNYDLNGIAGLGTVVAGISNTVYYNNNGTYGYWNVLTNTGSSGGYTDILPPMTGFYVKVSSGGPATLTLPVTSKSGSASDARSAHKGASMKAEKGIQAEKEIDIQKVKLVLAKGTKTDETIALLIDDADDTYNEHYDAYKLFVSASFTSPVVYINTSGSDYFMKAVQGPLTDEQVILPLKVVIKEAGTHIFNITEFENLESTKVVLRHGSLETLLGKDATYSFTSGVGTYTDFQLIIGEKSITTEVEKPIEQNFKTWYNNNFLYINIPSEISSQKFTLTVYDLQGKPVLNNNQIFLSEGQTIQVPATLYKGVYIVKVFNNNQSLVSKIVVF